MTGTSMMALMVCSAILSSCGDEPHGIVNAGAANETPSLTSQPGRPADVVASPMRATSATSAARVSALPVTCPATVGSAGALAVGTRRLGDPTATDLPLTDASIATVAPAEYDPATGNLSESEADDIEGGDYVTAAVFSYSPTLTAVSLVCRYGKSIQPLSGEAMLMIPLKPQWARCRYVAAQAGSPASMTCNRMKAVK
ncbi:MAG: hypothetical protein EOO77_00660 [Oxalobacteraceae bacterium]|nr:MAG: hypothetical protein EOO77_00660 [Oxalobacteraceae bacterium]